jgi:hypothetical protein
MNVRKQNHLLVVTNPLGLVLCNIDPIETVYFHSVTRIEQNFIHTVEENYNILIDCTIEE